MTTYSCVCYKYHYLQIRSPGALKQLSQSFLLLRHFAQHKVPTALSEREAINGFRWQRTSRTYEKFVEQFYASITSSYTVYGLTHRLNKLFWTKKVWITTSHKLSDLNCFLCVSSAWWCDVTNSFCFYSCKYWRRENIQKCSQWCCFLVRDNWFYVLMCRKVNE